MRVFDVLESLRYSDLSSFNLVEFSDSTKILDTAYPKINATLNRALRKLFSILPLRQAEVILQTRKDIQSYYLRPEHAVTNPAPLYAKYLLDSMAYPFLGEVIQVQSVMDELGNDYTINTVGSRYNVMLPEYDVIQVNDPELASALSVVYQAGCPTIDVRIPNQNVPIPVYLEEALIVYTMYCFTTSQSNAEATNKSRLLEVQFNDIIQSLKLTGLVQQPTYHRRNDFTNNGWR